ncbi:hypothetical protein V7S43_002552 [Phytophthora oleae]|uniref:Uncharacterized protein n=1 Tax=Phytophthora oleae TaxID=2107226 RepID=A0ABD3G3U3_9STRA
MQQEECLSRLCYVMLRDTLSQELLEFLDAEAIRPALDGTLHSLTFSRMLITWILIDNKRCCHKRWGTYSRKH